MKLCKRKSLVILPVLFCSLCIVIASCYMKPNEVQEDASVALGTRNLPGTISSISLTITGDDMDTVEVTDISPTDLDYTVELPAGTNRTFAMTILPDSGSFITSYYGEETVAELVAGETADVEITLEGEGTKLLIPDFEGDRAVLMDDISGTGWTVIDYTTAGFGVGRFHPYDVDFDSQGRIYIANFVGGSGMGDNRVVRMDDAAGTNRVDFSEIAYDYGVTSLAVDRINDYVYYSSLSGVANEKLLRSNLDGTSPTPLDVSSGVEAIQNIYGMDVDDNGLLYISGQNTSLGWRIFKYNPTTETVTHTYSTNLAQPRDVVYKDGSIFIANLGGADDYKILKIDAASLSTLEGNYGVDAGLFTENRNQGYFYEPWRFLAIRNRELYIIDDDDTDNYQKLVMMDDIAGTNWTTFKADDIGQTAFDYYYVC